jgi:hypothetical protein
LPRGARERLYPRRSSRKDFLRRLPWPESL